MAGRISLIQTVSGQMNFSERIKTDFSLVKSMNQILLGLTSQKSKSKALSLHMRTLYFVRWNAEARSLSSYGTPGERLSGQGAGQTGQGNGPRSGLQCWTNWVIPSAKMGSSLWSVSVKYVRLCCSDTHFHLKIVIGSIVSPTSTERSCLIHRGKCRHIGLVCLVDIYHHRCHMAMFHVWTFLSSINTVQSLTA